MSDLYEQDVFEWSQQQAALLRQHAAGERLNQEPDWTNIVEEVESVGQSQVDAIEALLFQAFLHDLKAAAWSDSRDVPAWQGDARGFRAQARRRYRSSMRQRLDDIAGIYADALSALPDTNDGVGPRAVPQTCPATLEDLMAKDR